MSYFKDITGQRFGRLIATEKSHKTKDKNWWWKCLCDCGNKVTIRGTSLRSGASRSCGCYKNELSKKRKTIHGLSYTKVYRVHTNMMSRCFNPKDKRYLFYGKRGILVCDEWKNVTTFYNWAINNGFKEGLTIERINVNGNYKPGNCKWIPGAEQGRNRRQNHRICFRGETNILSHWAKKLGVDKTTIAWRLSHNWTEEEALTIPIRGKRKAINSINPTKQI